MKIFCYKKILGRMQIEILCLKFVFVSLAKKRNHYISLGSNCFVRQVLTKYGIKPPKKHGELSCPFDLCITPLETLVKLLENDFEGFFDSIVFNDDCEELNMWINTNYSIKFVHDKNLSFEDLKKRYTKRIENFKNISKNASSLKYVMAVYHRNFTSENLNRVFNALLKLREGKAFKLIILSFVQNTVPDKIFTELNPNIIYKEIKIKDMDEFGANWPKPNYLHSQLLEEIAETVSK